MIQKAEMAANNRMGLIGKFRHWLTMPVGDRHALIRNRIQRLIGSFFAVGGGRLLAIYGAYQPDSYFLARQHAEFSDLFNRFTVANRRNNGGDIPRLWSLILNCKQVAAEKIPGDFAELGVWKGNSAAVLAHYAQQAGRSVYLFDTFSGFDPKDLLGVDSDKAMAFGDTSIELVRDNVGRAAEVCRFVKGRFPDSLLEEHRACSFAVVSVDCDLYEPMKAALEFFYPRMPTGALFMLHDYSSCQWNGAKRAIDEFCSTRGEFLILIPDKSGSAFLRKSK